MALKKLAFAFIALLFFLGCESITNSNELTYIGGEIVNPKNKSVIIYNTSNKVGDTILLDANNRFIHKLKITEPSLFSIQHGGEYQMAILETQDSVIFRINTYAFDESLVFTGKGSKKNNYLIRTYLYNEAETEKLTTYTQMEPEIFQKFIETRQQQQLNDLYNYLKTNPESTFFKSIIEANINYNTFADKEIYPFAYFGSNKLIHFKDLPEDFYAYRKTIDYNANYLSNFLAYNRFLSSHIDNLALKGYFKNKPHHAVFDRHSINYNKEKLNLITQLITNETLKNTLLKYKVREFINLKHGDKKTAEIFNHYASKSTNKTDKIEIKNLITALKSLSEGNSLPNLNLISFDNKEHTIKSLISKTTIIYFWSSNLKSQYRNSHYKAKELKTKFPDLNFISININDDNDLQWKRIINTYDFSKTDEYKFVNTKKALKSLAVNYVNKAIILDKDAIIIKPNANIYATDFESTLIELLKKSK